MVKGSLHLKTPDKQLKVEFNGRIVRVMKQENQIYRISLQFVDMNESIRSEIIRYCMYKQIELRNKIKGISLD